MTAVVWIGEGTWPACVDAARRFVPHETEILLLHVTPEELPGIAHGAYAGLFGRAEPRRDPAEHVEHLAADSAAELLQTAAVRLGRPCRAEDRTGQVEHEVLSLAVGADLLILARDGDLRDHGPRSLSHETRTVVDHAPCPVLLVWP